MISLFILRNIVTLFYKVIPESNFERSNSNLERLDNNLIRKRLLKTKQKQFFEK